ncbi:hypothetical protein [Mesorhizobium amorphae]|uniref:hypothetical protein n=1 Tax=Mesorhizobium amorphae TaxID=71433 RepID=UPI00118435F2|nr:hypothetical protein [Mesorhizobium amorphae]
MQATDAPEALAKGRFIRVPEIAVSRAAELDILVLVARTVMDVPARDRRAELVIIPGEHQEGVPELVDPAAHADHPVRIDRADREKSLQLTLMLECDLTREIFILHISLENVVHRKCHRGIDDFPTALRQSGKRYAIGTVRMNRSRGGGVGIRLQIGRHHLHSRSLNIRSTTVPSGPAE